MSNGLLYQLVELTLQKENITVEEIGRYLGISNHTLKSAVKSINERLNGTANICQDRNILNIKIFDYDEFRQIMLNGLYKETDFNSSQKRIAYIIHMLVNNSNISIDTVADKLMVSRGTINNDIKELKKILNNYELSLSSHSGKGGGIKIEGSEFEKRILLTNYVIDFFPDYYQPTCEIKNKINEIAARYQLNLFYKTLLCKTISVSIKRICMLQNVGIIPYYVNYETENRGLEELYHLIESTYEICMNQIEKDFMCFPINSRNIMFLDSKKIQEQEMKCRQLFEKIMLEIHKKIYLEIDEEELFQKMKYHILALMNRLLFRIETFELYLEEQAEKYSLAFFMATVSKRVIEKEVGHSISKSEISSLAIYFELALMNKKTNKVNELAVIGRYGVGETLLIRKRLRDIFGDDVRIKEFSENEIKTEVEGKFSIIVIPSPVEICSNALIIRTSNLFSDDYSVNTLKRLMRKESLHLERTVVDFRVLDDKYDYSEILYKIVDELIEKQYYSSDFKEKLQEREKKSSMFFGNIFAFPHATMNKKALALSVCVFKQELEAEKQKIKFIFLLGIPEQMDSQTEAELINLYEMILKIADRKDLEKNFRGINDKDAFIEFIYREDIIG